MGYHSISVLCRGFFQLCFIVSSPTSFGYICSHMHYSFLCGHRWNCFLCFPLQCVHCWCRKTQLIFFFLPPAVLLVLFISSRGPPLPFFLFILVACVGSVLCPNVTRFISFCTVEAASFLALGYSLQHSEQWWRRRQAYAPCS